jgi:hypothetical protein
MDHHPQRHRETQSKPNQIAGGLVCGPNGGARRRLSLATVSAASIETAL